MILDISGRFRQQAVRGVMVRDQKTVVCGSRLCTHSLKVVEHHTAHLEELSEVQAN